MIKKICDEDQVQELIADGTFIEYMTGNRPRLDIQEIRRAKEKMNFSPGEALATARGDITGCKYGDRLISECGNHYRLRIGDTWFIDELENPTVDDLFPKEETRMICTASELLKASKAGRLGMLLRRLYEKIDCNKSACLALGHKIFWRTGEGKVRVYAVENGVAVCRRTFDNKGWDEVSDTNVSYFTKGTIYLLT